MSKKHIKIIGDEIYYDGELVATLHETGSSRYTNFIDWLKKKATRKEDRND